MIGYPSEKALGQPVDSYGDEDHGCYQYCRAEEAGYVWVHVERVCEQTVEPLYYVCHISFVSKEYFNIRAT